MGQKIEDNPERAQSRSTAFDFELRRDTLRRSFAPMVKIVGPVCNLDCDYCYYLEKDALYEGKKFALSSFRMKEDVLERIISDHISSQPQQKVEFIWHGGEPTLAGLDYFRRIVELQQRHAGGKEIANVLQTNGTLIDDRWAEFLAENNFLCGLSIDGPEKFHDRHRRTPDGKGSWERAVRCAGLFNAHGVEFNTMTVVNSSNAREPVAVYKFLCELGSRYMQFSPIVERIALDECEPMSVVDVKYDLETAPMSGNVGAAEWGNFLCRIFDQWVRRDVGYRFVNWFDNTLAVYAGQQPTLCTMAPYCGCAPAVEHNGDVYSCDHFVFPDYLIGNSTGTSLADMVKSDRQLYFEERKKETLSVRCRGCEFLAACGGDCPKNRIARDDNGEPVSALCEGFKSFFTHTRSHFEFMARELENKRPPANIMKAVKKLG